LTSRFDVIVLGLGVMGAATTYHLARRGARVLGIDRYNPPHEAGSSHGESRIIREAYFEDPSYVPLVRRALELWEELEKQVDGVLLQRTGAIFLGRPEDEVVAGSIRSAQEHGVPIDILAAEAVWKRFPMLRPDPDMVGVLEAGAGVLDAEGCVAALLVAAEERGAVLRTDEPVERWWRSGSGVEVQSSSGRFGADFLVLAAGPWLPDMLPSLPLQVERQTMHWFEPRFLPESLRSPHCPVFLFQTTGGVFYGVPDQGSGVKAAGHHGGARGRLAELSDGPVTESDIAHVRDFLAKHVPPAAGRVLRSAVCRYTNTPSGKFLVSRLADEEGVWVLSACSGHGFKFAAAIGEAMAQRILDGRTALDLSVFGMTPA
jgi:sarcosine oxidase